MLWQMTAATATRSLYSRNTDRNIETDGCAGLRQTAT